MYEGREAVGSTPSTSRAAAVELSTSMLKVEGGVCQASGTKGMLDRPQKFIAKDSACWTPVAKERLGQLVCRSQNGTGRSSVCSEANVLAAVFELAACCSGEPAERVGERKGALRAVSNFGCVVL